MKNIVVFTLLLSAIFTACSDQLNVSPITEKEASNFYHTEIEIEEAVNATYATLQFTGLYNLNLPVLGEIPSDNTFDEVPANDGGNYGQLDEFTTITSNSIITGTWKDSYIGIQRANTVLNRIEEVDFADESVKSARDGEMRFIRALLYFNLVRIYGDIPLVTEETTDPSAYFGQGRAASAEVYNQILQDLETAVGELPAQSDRPGRVVRSAAQTLLAKVQLTLNDFQSARSNLESVVSSGIYSLLDDPARVFAADNEWNAEIIFAVQFASGINGNTEGSDAFQQFSPSGTINGAKGHNLPTRSFYSLYDANDLRKTAYVSVTADGVPFSTKYKQPITSPNDGGSDWIVLRYADVLLMLAEAENELNNPEQAGEYLNLVRSRAGLAPITANDQAGLREAIALERRLELIGEGHRWFDLIRTGKAVSTMNDWFAEQNINIVINTDDLLMPVPQGQIDTDPTLRQNPGY